MSGRQIGGWGAALAVVFGLVAAARAQGEGDDAERVRAVESWLKSDPQLKDDRVVVEVTGKRVRLSGTVDDAAERRRAEELVRETDPTLQVENLLQAEGQPEVPPDPKIVVKPTDAAITNAVKFNFGSDPAVDARTINVVTDSQVVYLRGQVRTEAERMRVINIAGMTYGVLVVVDEMKLAERR